MTRLEFYDQGLLTSREPRWSAYLPVFTPSGSGRWVLLGFEARPPEPALELLNVLVCRSAVSPATRQPYLLPEVGIPKFHDSPFLGELSHVRAVDVNGATFILGYSAEPGGHA